MAKKTAIAICVLFVVSCAAVVAYFYLFAEFPVGESELAFRFADVARLKADSDRGLIHVQGEARSNVEINATKIVAPRLPWFVGAVLDEIDVTAEADDAILMLTTRARSDWRGSAKVDTVIAAPAQLPIEIAGRDANLTALDMAGPVDIRHAGDGTTVIERTTGAVRVVNDGGIVRINLAAFVGPIDVESARGEVVVELHELSPGPVSVRVEKGRVSVTMRREVQARLRYRSTGLLFDQFAEDPGEPERGDGAWVERELGNDGAEILIDAGNADLTIHYFDEAG